MALLISQAVEIIVPVLDALLAGRGALSDTSRRRVEALVLQHGPDIASASGWDAPSRICAFLNDLSEMGSLLPAQIIAELQKGQSGAALPTLSSLSSEKHQAIKNRLIALYDFRVFDDPSGLAAELSDLVTANAQRLLSDERTAWEVLVESYSQTRDVDTFLRAAARLLAGYPAVRQLIEAHRRWAPSPTYRGGELAGFGAKGIIRGAGTARDSAAAASASEQMVRYANVNFPNKVLLTEKRVTLLIQVTREHQTWSATSVDESRMSVKLAPLTIVVTAEDFSLDGAIGGDKVEDVNWARRVQVKADSDCDPVAFLLTPKSIGPKKIQIDFYQFDRNILTLSLQTEVTDNVEDLRELRDVEIRSQSMESPALGESAPIPDLELRIIMSADRTKLFYLLHAPKTGDYNFKAVGQVDLGVDPQTFLKPTFDRLNTLARLSSEARTEDQKRSALQELDDIGVNLYTQLFPADLRAEYRTNIRTAYKQKGLLITSDEPWVPWEMVKPYESDENGNELVNDLPLCATFKVSRWISGRGTPDLVRLRRGVWVAPQDNLQAAQRETDYFMGLRRTLWTLNLDGPLGTVADVDERFRGGSTEHYHFACHGNFNTDDPNESKLKLAGDFLRPSQIAGPKQAGLRKSKPLIFLNACYSGRTGVGLTQLGGWAQKFLDSGASAFIGSLWEINDSLAAQFAQEFYDRLWGLGTFEGRAQPLGQAFYEARMAIKDADPANPTWLAYVLYGDPYGRVVLDT